MNFSLKIATVGCGFFSQFHHEAWQRLAGQGHVVHVGVCDIDESRAQDFARLYAIEKAFTDFSVMLDKVQPDLVDIILPPDQHLTHIEKALKQNCHVICQKAFTRDIHEAKQAAEQALRADRMLVVHENFRFQPWFRQIRRLLDDNLLGQVYQARFALRPGDGQGPEAYLDRQPYFQQMKPFLIKETGIHFIDTFRFLFGPVNGIWADLGRLNPVILGEDSGLFMFHHDGGTRSLFDGNRLSDHAASNRRLTMGEMQVEGERGTLSLNGDGELGFRAFGSNETQALDYEWRNQGYGGDCVYALQRHVIEHLRDGSLLENAASDYLENLALQSLVYRSSEEGRRIDRSAAED